MSPRTSRRTPARALASLVALLAIVFCASAAPATAAGPNAIVDLAGCSTNTLPANDDGSTGAVPIGFTASFFGTPYTSLFVNNNGNVTFDQALGQYTPFDFSISGTVIIAPFLADVDTRGVGSSQVTYGQTTYEGQPALCVNWRNVGYFGQHVDKLNAIQLLLVKRSDAGAFDIIFNYDQVQWETGDASGGTGGFGGTPAAWGFSQGDGDPAHYFVGPGSFSSGALVDGGPAALIASNRGTSQLGRYIFAVSATGSPGPKLAGDVTAGADPAAFAPVQICPVAGGACITRTTNSAGRYQASGLNGSYNLTAFPPSEGDGSNRAPGRVGPVTVAAVDVEQDIALGPAPSAPPPDTTITSIGTNPDGIPVAYWNDPLTLTTQGCAGGTANYELRIGGTLVRSGAMAEGPPGTYTAVIAPLIPLSGDGVIHVTIACPVPADNEVFDFGIYIDPSGLVRDSLGAPVNGATVVLFRSGTPDGTFAPVPDESAVMSPGNRSNPDFTVASGRFGWDVVAGYYKVRASKPGCVSNANRSAQFVDSAVLTIPPPVTDLDLRLFCGEGGTTTPPPPPPPGGPPPDRTAPILTSLKVTPRTFKASARTTAIAAATRKRTPSGTKITFRLNERANVVLTISRKTVGRRVGTSCRKLTKSNRKRKKCTLYVVSGTLTRSGLAAGARSVAFSGRIGTRKLAPGSYRVVAQPVDVAGNRGLRRTAPFKIVRR